MDQASGQSNSTPSKTSGPDPQKADASPNPEQKDLSSPDHVTINFSDAPQGHAQKPPSASDSPETQKLNAPDSPQYSQRDALPNTEIPLANISPKAEKPKKSESPRCIQLKKNLPDIVFNVGLLIVTAMMFVSVYCDGWNSDDDSLRKMSKSDSKTEQVTSIIMLICGNSAILEYLYLLLTRFLNRWLGYSTLKRYKRTMTSIISCCTTWLVGVVAMCVCAGRNEYAGWPFILSLVTVPAMMVTTVYGCWYASKLKAFAF